MVEEREYVPDHADEFAMPPPEEDINSRPTKSTAIPVPEEEHATKSTTEKALTEEQQYEAAMEKMPPAVKSVFAVMRRLGRSKSLMALMLGGSLSGIALEKVQEYDELHRAERIVAEQRANVEHQRQAIGQRLRHLQEVFGDHNPFGSFTYESLTVDVNEADVAKSRRNLHWYTSPGTIGQLRDPFEFQHGKGEASERGHSLVATDLRGRSPIENRDAKIPADSLKSILERDFPKGWVEGEIDSVIQTSQVVPMPNEYGTDGIEDAHCQTSKNGRSTIVFSGGIQQETVLYTTMEVLPHEIAHANDWQNDRQMTYEERVTLLDDVAQRIEAPDRWKSYYVESISNPNLYEQRYIRAAEYWAEICAAYFHAPTTLNKKDFDIVDRMIRRTDPAFNVRHSINHRADVIWGLQSAEHQVK